MENTGIDASPAFGRPRWVRQRLGRWPRANASRLHLVVRIRGSELSRSHIQNTIRNQLSMQ